MSRQPPERPEDSPYFGFDLTPGEVAMFEKIRREEAVHNVLGAALGAYRDRIFGLRNEFVGELCKKYRIENPKKVTYDYATKRFVSVLSADLVGLKVSTQPPALEACAVRHTLSAVRELLAIYQATQEAAAAAPKGG